MTVWPLAAPPTAPPPAPTRAPRLGGAGPPRDRAAFVTHVARLHADSDVGFSKEYEIVVSKSAALGQSSHYSLRPENRLKNRYLNITAYDHSRVCVSSGGQCGAPGCVGATVTGAGGVCDYVNANFIDGFVATLDDERIKYIRRKLERRGKPLRQPSTKPAKPPPSLTEGIESAFLNIEFSGIVDDAERPADDEDDDDDDEELLDDVYVDIDGKPTQVKLEWLLWRRRYIATQGPTPATLDAFWRMIWQHRVHTIVMITNLVERGRRKCDIYWPSGGRGSSASWGGVTVTLSGEDVRAAYTVREMTAVCGDTRRTVTQYHYTVWPDHGAPRHPLAVLPFVRAAAADPRTVLVHCSAGVGRTGTYIVLDAQLNQLQLTGTLSPLGFLCRARTQRNHLVQTEEQYIFVHDALLEHVRSGNTEVEYSKATEYLVNLLLPIDPDELATLDLMSNNSSNKTIDLSETVSIKSNHVDSDKTDLPNGDGSIDESSEKSIRVNGDDGDDKDEVLVNGDSDGIYDLAPRSTDTFSKKMQAYNSLSEQEKEEIRRTNRAENYAILERMRSLSNRSQQYQGPPPCNLLEKQYLLIMRSGAEASVCALAPHNAEKNRKGASYPTDPARVMLVPKPGVEGSEYVNASWVWGRRRLREFAVGPWPETVDGAAAAALWRMLWDHTAQLLLALPGQDCETFWPTEDEKELFIANFRASFVSKETYVAYRKADRKTPSPTPEPEMNGHRKSENGDCSDDERLIPENSPTIEEEPSYRFDRTELRLERLSAGSKDLSARKSIANGDLFSSFSEKRGPKSPKSPSKMSLKNFKLSSPTKFKFPDWGSKSVGQPPETAPPPPPIPPSLSVEEEADLKRPVYYFEKVETVPDGIPADRVIEVTNVSVHSLQDDYQLSVKFIKCCKWLDSETTEYIAGKPDANEFVRNIREAKTDEERLAAVDAMTAPFKDSFALIEFIAGCQMEYKNGPVVVIDKYGGHPAMSLCTLSAARNPTTADVYCWAALAAHARAPPAPPAALLTQYGALREYGRALGS